MCNLIFPLISDLKRYACVLEVTSVSLNDSSDQAWTDELLNKTSEIYSTVKGIAEQQVCQAAYKVHNMLRPFETSVG